ncbi:FecR domain-containing protein [Acinetobacter sp. ANC 3882]|uniref:FecR family protein n=1 Tax=Acinetobacter sp. ANC 3882 TaxID=2923423 RepID=UPI001F4AC623|nr:FecR domain-containing protein [Acinetobacter sp. ANC 3882]MCH7315030.1 FecR domain-containing protein [Acinetobacter sp. ANC 3882]
MKRKTDAPYSKEDKQQAYEQAAQWYIELHEKSLDERQQAEFEEWLTAEPLHQQVWRNVTMFDEKLNRVSKHQIDQTFQQLESKQWNIGKLSLVFMSVFPVLYVYQAIRQQDYLPELWSFAPIAIYNTGKGEQRQFTLADGSRVWLNSNSKIRIKYNQHQRRIELAKGEIYIETHKDPFKRQFSVQTSHGNLVALGTVFNVRYFPEKTELLVQQGTVRILTKDRQIQQDIPAQHAAIFNQDSIRTKPYQATQMLWRQQLLVVHSMLLGQFVNELKPHYQGEIQLEPALDNILISGSYSTQDIEKTLTMVANTHHLNIQTHQQKIQLSK